MEVVYKKNPITQLKDREVITLNKSIDNLGQVIYELNANPNSIICKVNGEFIDDCLFPVKKSDFIEVITIAKGGGLSEDQGKTLSTIVSIAALVAIATLPGIGLGATALFFAQAGIAIGSALINMGIRSLIRPPQINDKTGSDQSGVSAYSASAGSNAVRPYQAYNLLLGKYLMFPDFASKPYTNHRGTGIFFSTANNPVSVSITVTYFSGSVVGMASPTNGKLSNNTYLGINGEPVVFNSINANRSPSSFDFSDAILNQWSSVDLAFDASNAIFGLVGLTVTSKLYDVISTITSSAINTNTYTQYLYQNILSPTQTTSYDIEPWTMFNWFGVNYYIRSDKVANWGAYISAGGNPVGGVFPLGLFPPNWATYPASFKSQYHDPALDITTVEPSITYKIPQSVTITSEKTEQLLVQIMNYGFGDLVFSDEKLGDTKITDLVNYHDDYNVKDPFSWYMPNIPSNYNQIFDRYFTNVDAVDGGELNNNDVFSYPGNHIHRVSPVNCSSFELLLEGILYETDTASGGSISDYSASFDVDARQLLPTVSSWVNLGQYNLNGTGDYPCRFKKYFSPFLSANQIEVRVRKVTPDTNNLVNSPNENIFQKVNFLINFIQDETSNYIAQNRYGIVLAANNQVNGALQKINAMVQSKCWVHDRITNLWSWTTTQNPAFLFLYFARGGFSNFNYDGTASYPDSPTIGWANGVRFGNRERLWGCGLEDSRIDIDSIIAWANFCDDNDLKFSAVINSQEPCSDVLIKIASVGRASPTWAKGKLSVVIEDGNQEPVAMFTPSNIIKGSFSVSYLTEKTADEVVATYYDENNNYEQMEVRALKPGVLTPEETIRIDFFGITRKDQAQREVNLIAARQLYQIRKIEFETDYEGLVVTRGDLIYLSHDLTQWDYGGRFVELTIDSGFVVKAKIDRSILTTSDKINIRKPDGTFLAFPITLNQDGDEIQIASGLWSAQDAPEIIDQSNLINPQGVSGSFPEDFIYIVGFSNTSGKVCRIISIQPSSMNRVKITCTDEESAMYAYEFDNTYLAPNNIDKLVAKVFNVLVEDVSGGKKISWQTESSYAVTIDASVNGGLFFPVISNTGFSHFGNEYIFDNLTSGDFVTVKINPYLVGIPYDQEGAEIAFTM